VGERKLFWIGSLAITLIAAILRFRRLGESPNLVFDETYYVSPGYPLTDGALRPA
jgi:dolichyl-phosphate-mannose--protein O-mannosyl transferase